MLGCSCEVLRAVLRDSSGNSDATIPPSRRHGPSQRRRRAARWRPPIQQRRTARLRPPVRLWRTARVRPPLRRWRFSTGRATQRMQHSHSFRVVPLTLSKEFSNGRPHDRCRLAAPAAVAPEPPLKHICKGFSPAYKLAGAASLYVWRCGGQ